MAQTRRHEEIADALGALPFAERDFEMLLIWARALNDLGRCKEAEEMLSSVADEGKDDPCWNYQLGYALREQGRAAEALPFSEQAVYLNRLMGKGADKDFDALLATARAALSDERKCEARKKMPETKPKTQDELKDVYLNAGLGRLWDVIGPHVRNAVLLRCETAADADIPVGASKFGGNPDLPPGADWPHRNGTPMTFLAQIAFSDAKPHDAAGELPDKGFLWLFYDADDQPWGYDPKHKDGHKVICCAGDASDLTRAAPPETLDADFLYPSARIAFDHAAEAPSFYSNYCDDVNLTDEEADLYWTVLEMTREEQADKLLGHSDNVQNAMELECQLAANGLYCGDGSGYRDPRAKELKKTMLDWVLLMQIDSDDGFMWGDDGRLYLWIRKDDLAARNFDRTWLILQCY
jgi:uncharacterized protein YwqG